MAEGRYADAVLHLTPVAAANPNQKKLLLMLAEAQQKAGDTKAAKATRKKAEALK